MPYVLVPRFGAPSLRSGRRAGGRDYAGTMPRRAAKPQIRERVIAMLGVAGVGLFGLFAPFPAVCAEPVVSWPSATAVHTPKARPVPDTASSSRFKKAEHVLRFINDYRDNKDPESVPGAFKAMARLSMLTDPEKAGIYVGFLAGVIGENQTTSERLIDEMFPLPPREQVILIKAIAFCGLPEWKDILSRFAERMPARNVIIKKYLYGGGKTLDELSPNDGPFVLDALWGYYFATGAWAPVQRIIGSLELFRDENDVETRTIGAMAKWTYATNATRDKNLLDLAKSEMNHQPATVRQDLREVIEAAELFETSRLRSDAVASIDALKAKGPKRVRDWNYWGNAGTTALALGCVAAAALGQAQLGIPCVVGGALSTAAVKYLGPTE